MGMSAGGNKGGAKSDINVTPLVDVCLVLLIIFMVVTPMLQQGKDVNLPSVNKEQVKKDTGKLDQVVLSITADKKTYVEKSEFEGPALKDKLRDELIKDPMKEVLLKGDESLTFGEVRKVMKTAQDAGFKGIKLGVQEKNGKS